MEAARAKVSALEHEVETLREENAELKELVALDESTRAQEKITQLMTKLKELRLAHRAEREQREAEFSEEVSLMRGRHVTALEALRTKLVDAAASNKEWERLAQFQSGTLAEHTPTIDLEDRRAVLSAMRTKTRAGLMELDLHALRHEMVDLETHLRLRPADQVLQKRVQASREVIRRAEKDTARLTARLKALELLLGESI